MQEDIQLNLISVINDPDQRADIATLLANLYDKLNLADLIEYFYSKTQMNEEIHTKNSLDPQTIILIEKTLYNSKQYNLENMLETKRESSEELFIKLKRELHKKFFEKEFEINDEIFDSFLLNNAKEKLLNLSQEIDDFMFSQKNQNFADFYRMVHSFTMITKRADFLKELICKNQKNLRQTESMLQTNVLDIQKKIKKKIKLRE